jgi:hypothetical protein
MSINHGRENLLNNNRRIPMTLTVCNNGTIIAERPKLTPMDRLRGIVLSGIRAGHSKNTIMEELRTRTRQSQFRIRVTDANVIAYIDGVFDAVEALGVKC